MALMDYHYSVKTSLTYDKALERITESLKNQGFGIITTIDVTDTFKQKLDVSFRKYRILGACNPEFAYRALTMDSHLGVMLPCNVTVQEHENGGVEVSAVNPFGTLDLKTFPHLKEIADEVSRKLRAAVDDLHTKQFRKEHAEALPD
jgi:uncharacterized protein (DUF302 family)